MAITTVPASQGSATFSSLDIVINLTVPNTLAGDIVEIINNVTSAVLGTAVQTGTTTNWRATLTLPSNTTTVNISARTKRGSAFSTNAIPAFALTYQAPA
jgi:dihydrodipicolinate reductase